jgi:hypothetical protein
MACQGPNCKIEVFKKKETAMHDPSSSLAARLSYLRPVAFRPTVFGGLALSGYLLFHKYDTVIPIILHH